jgi:hypothetical protein
MSIHAKDQDQIERQHGLAVADIHERLITLQDASYELGYARGLENGKAKRDKLLVALKELLHASGIDQLAAAQASAQAAIHKATGGAA